MREIGAVQTLVSLIHRLHDGLTNLNEAKRAAYEVFQSCEGVSNEALFDVAFPVMVEYFLDPAKKARVILQRKEISKDNLLASHRFVSRSKLAKMIFFSSKYPRSLLIKSAANLLGFMRQNPKYLPKILRGEMVGPMMLELGFPVGSLTIFK